MPQRIAAAADLHTHSTASDGLDSPAALVELASERGISVLAIADHDTVSGIPEGLEAAGKHGMRLVPALEFSVRARRGQTHILGYGIDVNHSELVGELEDLRRGREERGWRIIERLQDLGISLPANAESADRPGGSPGRPHIARGLVEIGAADSVQDAFDRYLATGRPAFVPRRVLPAEHAIELIKAAGGLAVLAHPLSVYELDIALPRMIDAGLAGIEAHYGEYSQDQRHSLVDRASSYNLLVTGGSDYHGRPETRGRVLGSVSWPEAALDALLERLE